MSAFRHNINVKVGVRLTDIKPYSDNPSLVKNHYFKPSANIFSRFKKAHITEASKEAHSHMKVCENTFEEIGISL